VTREHKLVSITGFLNHAVIVADARRRDQRRRAAARCCIGMLATR
jgi:hypothetical protein